MPREKLLRDMDAQTQAKVSRGEGLNRNQRELQEYERSAKGFSGTH
jgi:hypothetical protein